jgi:beta-lactamase superfamily II metal-dependent hydrolase
MKMKKFICILILSAVLNGIVSAQTGQEPTHPAQSSEEDLKSYVPVLPSVKAKFWKIDPNLGYAVKNVGGGVYVISDNGWQSAFLVTDEGVIVLDAPASFGKNIPSAIAKVTDKPIKMLVYSHVHKDHIGGSAAFQDIKGLQIVALTRSATSLRK